MIHTRQKKGQILVLAALSTTTLIILFGMVVAIGHLVQAKINLQNSVDLAAMAGASWQARYLNQVSQINYRLRQNYKFILYDLYVTQSRFNTGLRQQIAGNPAMFQKLRARQDELTFGICQQTGGYQPVTALGEPGQGVTSQTDICRNVRTSSSGIPPLNPIILPPFSPIAIAISAASAATVRRFNESCDQYGGQNRWYFHEYIMPHLLNRQRFQMTQMARVLQDFNGAFNSNGNDVRTNGSNLKADKSMMLTFTRNLIRASRNSAMKLEYLNDPKSRTYKDNPATIRNLNVSVPAGNSPGNFGEYFDINSNIFQMIFIEWGSQNNACISTARKESFPQKVLLGLSRSRTSAGLGAPPKRHFNIVVKGTVKPNLLFWPSGLTPTLTAVGAAKPFGSRIAPSQSQTAEETTGTRTPGANALANMSLYPGDITRNPNVSFGGVGHARLVKLLTLELPDSNGINTLRPNPKKLDINTCNQGTPDFMCMSLAPTLYEGLFYNPFPFPSGTARRFGVAEFLLEQSPFNFLGAITTADNSLYQMPDRLPGITLSSGEIDAWHLSFPIGHVGSFRHAGGPAYFADWQSMMSSWAPNITPSNLRLNNSQNQSGRMGYAIKLVSIEQICKEDTPTPELRALCGKIFH